MSLTATVRLQVDSKLTGVADLSSPTDQLKKILSVVLANGSGANQAQQHWHDERTLSATSENLDLAASLTNGLGQTVTFSTVKTIIIYNKSTTSGQVIAVGGAAANQFVNWVANSSDIVRIGPGGFLALSSPVDGFAVVAGTGDQLKIDAGAATITYGIIIIGT